MPGALLCLYMDVQYQHAQMSKLCKVLTEVGFPFKIAAFHPDIFLVEYSI